LDFEIVKALDINDTANKVYNSIHPGMLAHNRTLESLSESECLGLKADLWTMSPPCQPFTRMGKRRLGEDNRSLSFHRIIALIQTVRPAAILLENVKGFELSDAWKELLEALFHAGYEIRQFLLTPLQFGIPNCRLRFYLVAKRRDSADSSFSFCGSLPVFEKATEVSDMLQLYEKAIIRLPPPDAPSLPNCGCAACTGKLKHISAPSEHFDEYLEFCRPLSDFLLPGNDLPTLQHVCQDSLRLSEEKVTKFYRALDIVTPDSRKSACFTKGYSQRFEGTGSFLLFPGENSMARTSGEANNNADDIPKLRYFHSQEVANLMCFPPSFSKSEFFGQNLPFVLGYQLFLSFIEFPPEITEKQRLRLLGNSINVLVVAHVMYWAFATRTEQ
uniref:tRNA (Cytosine(38)-C(5))-methyltransferase n=1 Tax=Schistocephalus solidus TaxID=70667 RepID=A0A183TPG0_SCHSO